MSGTTPPLPRRGSVRRDRLCSIPVVLGWAVVSDGMASWSPSRSAVDDRSDSRGQSQPRGRLLFRRPQPGAAGASLGRVRGCRLCPTRQLGLLGLSEHRLRVRRQKDRGWDCEGAVGFPIPRRARGRSVPGRRVDRRLPAMNGDRLEEEDARDPADAPVLAVADPRAPAGGDAVWRRRSVVRPAGPGRHPDARDRPLRHARQASHDCGSVK